MNTDGPCALRRSLEFQAHGQLGLARVAHPDAQKAIEVKQSRRSQRTNIVLVVEQVEYLDLRKDSKAFADAEPSRNTEVECEKGIVFAQVVASTVGAVYKPGVRVGDAARRSRRSLVCDIGDGLRGMCLHAYIGVKTPRQIGHGVKIELVALIAVGV